MKTWAAEEKVFAADLNANFTESLAQTFGVFGDGSDGNVTISVDTTLASDKYYNNLTVNNGITLRSGGYRIYVKGILTNNGTISNSGYDASAVAVTAGAGGNAGTLLGGASGGNGGGNAGGGGGGGGVLFLFANNVAVEGNIFAKGGNGGNARGSGAGVVGVSGGNITNAIVSANGGRGGANNTDQVGGVISNLRAITEKSLYILSLFIDAKNLVALAGGAGGGGGTDVQAGRAGGGGGGGGGTILYVYKTITTAGTVSVAGGIKGTSVGTPTYPSADGTAGKIVKFSIA